MNHSRFQWLASIVRAHPQQKIVGRIRLQKTVRLLQRLGLPTDYTYQLYYYGPYCEGLLSDVRLLEQLKMVEEKPEFTQSGDPYYVLTANADVQGLPDVKKFKKHIDLMAATPPVILELAATYDAYRDLGFDHKESLIRLKNKKAPSAMVPTKRKL